MSSRTPISIEALLAKQKAAELEAAKPKFLSKAERAKIALAKRVAEVESIKNVQVARDIARDDLIKKGAEAGREMGYNNYNRDGNYSRDGGLNYGNSNLNGRNGGGYGNSRGGSRNNNYDNRSNNNNNRNRPGIGIDKRNESQNNQRDMGGIPTGPRGNSAKEEIKLESTPMEIDSIKSEEKSEIKLEFDSKPPLPFNAPPPPPPPPSDMPPPPPPSSLPPPPPLVKLTLAEMAESQAKLMSISSIPAPLNSTLNGLRYLGEKAIDKRKSRKISDKKFIFDWDKMDDTGAGEVDPIYAPYIPKSLTKVDKNGRGYGIGKDDRVKGGGNGVGNIEGMINKVGMYGRGMLAGFDRELTETKAKGPIDERHWSEKLLIEMKDRDWRIFREDFSISTRGGSIPLPLRNWSESNIPQQILDVIEEIGYNEPSPIQRQSIPIGLMNRDQIGVAETGSGKTAAFVVPMLAYISRLPPLSDENRLKGPYALVLAPTRELAQQIETETNKFTKLLGYKCVSIVGGRAIEEQQFNMKDGAEIIIATPGRLKDCLERSILVLSQCTYVVMDEADRMVSLGFEEVINFILDALPVTNLKPDSLELEDEKKMNLILSNSDDDDNLIDTSIALYRQTVMFSATMPAAVERLAKKYLRRPAIVTIGIAGQAVDTVDQRVEFISGDDKKKKRLIEILNSGEFEPPMIIFVNQKKGADVLMKDLVRAQWNVTTLHSGKNQEQREAALNSIRNKECDVLVATDLAGRGIDVSDVSLVVNFQMANNIEAYVHRIGRTGRAGKTGTAITFLNDADEELMYDLKTLISKSPVSKLPNELLRHPAAQTKLSSSMKRRAGEIED